MENEIKPGLDGLYAVCFVNDKAYDEKKVREIFGRYGHVLSVRFTGQEERQLVFVRYKEYNEIKCCMDDLNKTNELTVKLAFPSRKLLLGVPYRQTGKFSRDKCSSNNQVSGVDSINHRRPFHKNFKYGSRKIRNVHPNLGNHHSENENYSKNIEGTKQSNEIPKNEDPADHKTLNRHTDYVSGDDTQGTGDTEGKVNYGNGDVKHSDKEGSLKNSDNSGQMLHKSHATNGFIDDGPPLLVASEDLPNGVGFIDDGPPPLVASEDLPDDVDEETEIYAEDIIIANLPPSVDEYDVMRFAWRNGLNPVHVSPIEMTGMKYNILFCHLWMENEYEAEMAEVVLGGACMEGNTLLVARAENLLCAFHDTHSTFATS
jgi:hypothetical protein